MLVQDIMSTSTVVFSVWAFLAQKDPFYLENRQLDFLQKDHPAFYLNDLIEIWVTTTFYDFKWYEIINIHQLNKIKSVPD